MPTYRQFEIKVAAPLRLLTLLLAASVSPICAATEPLVDQLTLGEHTGIIWPKKCCWVDLPGSEKLRELRLAERCTATGGPVGVFRLDGKRIMLTALKSCSRSIPLHEIYPDKKSPLLADWVSGLYNARLDWLCYGAANKAVYRIELELEIKNGIVAVLSERKNDKGACLANG